MSEDCAVQTMVRTDLPGCETQVIGHDLFCSSPSQNPTQGSGASTGSGAGKPPEFGPVLQH